MVQIETNQLKHNFYDLNLVFTASRFLANFTLVHYSMFLLLELWHGFLLLAGN